MKQKDKPVIARIRKSLTFILQDPKPILRAEKITKQV